MQGIHDVVSFSRALASPSATISEPEMPMQSASAEWKTNGLIEYVQCQRRREGCYGLNLFFMINYQYV